LAKQMKCRNEGCGCHRENQSDDTNCNDWSDLTKCSVYNNCLPLWESQDKCEDKTKGGCEYVFLERFGEQYFGRIWTGSMWIGMSWDKKGRPINTSIADEKNFALIPKKTEQKDWYGVVDTMDHLISICQKDSNPAGLPEGWKIVKLKKG